MRAIFLLGAAFLSLAALLACESPLGGSEAEACRANDSSCRWSEERDLCECGGSPSPSTSAPVDVVRSAADAAARD
jgi:hypothetical protein